MSVISSRLVVASIWSKMAHSSLKATLKKEMEVYCGLAVVFSFAVTLKNVTII